MHPDNVETDSARIDVRNDVMKSAAVRGLVQAAIAAGSAFFTGLQLVDVSVTKAAILAGSAFFTALAVRFGGEGTIDVRRV